MKESQCAIADHLDQAVVAVNKAIREARAAIQLLREYRTRLISEIVTGKVDVREVAARLPIEAHESELSDEAGDSTADDDVPANDVDDLQEETAE